MAVRMEKREILVWAEQREGKLIQASREAIALGRHLADLMNLSLAIALNGGSAAPSPHEMADQSGEEIWLIDPEIPGTASYEVYGEAVRQMVSRFSPQWILMGHSSRVVDFVPRLAVRMDCAFIPGCLDFRYEHEMLSWIRPAYEGRFHQQVIPSGHPPFLVSIQPGAFARLAFPQAGGGMVHPLSLRIPSSTIRRRVVESSAGSAQGTDLAQARTVVAGGRGMGSREQFEWIHQLALLLEGATGASRPAVEAGWAARGLQIGSSGQFVSPRLLLACGISGAIHHAVGVSGAGCIVAINQDPLASIFRIADYGIVGKVEEILPALIEELHQK